MNELSKITTKRPTSSQHRPKRIDGKFAAVAIEARFWEKVSKTSDGTCWLWTGCKFSTGYGMIGTAKKACSTHRISWILHNGPIPDGLAVLHRCDVRNCVNPEHLFLGTRADNNADKTTKGRQAKGDNTTYRLYPHLKKFGIKCNLSKLVDVQVLDIRRRLLAGESYTRIASDYNVTKTCIYNIRHRKSWNHL